MSTTPILGITELAQNQNNPDVTVNEGTRTLEVAASKVVQSRASVSPPGSPSAGDRYIVPVGATGIWAGHDNEIAWYLSDWEYLAPELGLEIFIQDELVRVIWDGSEYIALSGEGNLVDFAPIDIAVRYEINAFAGKLNLHVIGDCILSMINLPQNDAENPTLYMYLTFADTTVTWPVEWDWGSGGIPEIFPNITLAIRISCTDKTVYAETVGRFNPGYELRPLTITNPGDDPSDTTGWTPTQGAIEVGGVSPNRYFFGGDEGQSNVKQELNMLADGVTDGDIDNGNAILATIWQAWSNLNDAVSFGVSFWDDDPSGSGQQVGSSVFSNYTSPDVWTVEGFNTPIPIGARWCRLVMLMQRNDGIQNDGYWRTIRSSVNFPRTAPQQDLTDSKAYGHLGMNTPAGQSLGVTTTPVKFPLDQSLFAYGMDADAGDSSFSDVESGDYKLSVDFDCELGGNNVVYTFQMFEDGSPFGDGMQWNTRDDGARFSKTFLVPFIFTGTTGVVDLRVSVDSGSQTITLYSIDWMLEKLG